MAESAQPPPASSDDGASGDASTALRGLPGDNPLGLLAALGAQAALSTDGDYKLSWTEEPIPRALLMPSVSLEAIGDAALRVAAKWLNSRALARELDSTLKLRPPDIREYLNQSRLEGVFSVLASCLLAEDSLDGKGSAKPTDLYFTAGKQEFVNITRTILGNVTADHITDDLGAPWKYGLHEPPLKSKTLMWDATDDRQHAHSAADPTDNTANPKLTNPGAEALAVIGLSRYPCFAADQTLTQGCSGSWKRGSFTWPLWKVPATKRAVRSLLAQVAEPVDDQRRGQWYRSWGVSRVMKSQIRRSDQGGYGTFGPARVVWQRE